MGEYVVDGKAEQRSDLDLVAAVNRGQWEAFDQLYFRYRDWAYRLAWRFCGSETDAQDVVQEVFVYLAGKFRTGLDLRAGLTTLLYPAVKHTALAIKQKRRGGGRMLDMPEEMEIVAPLLAADVDAVRGELATVLQTLSAAHREVVLMRFVDDMTLEEIAVALAVPVGTVKSRLHHALAAVRENGCLRKYFEPK
jgi:RNA polymerase sigma-70 factor, ECF subfamily